MYKREYILQKEGKQGSKFYEQNERKRVNAIKGMINISKF